MKDKEKQIEEMKNNARIYIGAVVEKLRMDGCELWEIDGIVENILNYITVPEDSVVLTKSEKEKLLKEMYEQGKFDATADLEKNGKVVLTKEELSKRDYEFRQIGYDECLRDNPKKDKYIKTLERKIDQLNAKLDQARKETAEKILNELYHREEMGFETIKWYAKEYWGVEIKE